MTSLLQLLHTSAPPPALSLNLLALSLVDPTTLPSPPASAPSTVHQTYHQLRTRLFDPQRHPLSDPDFPAAMRRVGTLGPNGGLFAPLEDEPAWAAMEAIKRIMDRSRPPPGARSGQQSEGADPADWAGIGGDWGPVALRDEIGRASCRERV